MSGRALPSALRHALLTPEEMASADRLAADAGVSFERLIEAAGAAVAGAVQDAFSAARSVAVLVGPGHNGEDAIAAARCLRAAGREVRLFFMADFPVAESGDAEALAKEGWRTDQLDAFDPSPFDLVLDGLLGAGLSRPVTDAALASAIRKANASPVPVVSIDLPSGVSGEGGALMGEAMRADLTVTFFRRKPGHLLQPGRAHCGRTIVADIGIPDRVLGAINPATFANVPGLWHPVFPVPSADGHKYDRGHAVVFSGGSATTGAARMSAMAALRAGAGLATVFSPASAMLVNASHLTAVMLKRCEDLDELGVHLQDVRFNAAVLGPGFGIGEKARAFTLAVLAANRALVLDADGISAFKDEPDALWSGVGPSGALVLTPHAGEFKRLFPDLATADIASKADRARAAAKRSGAVVVLKGSDTVIAAPDGRAAINETGTPWLATAGSGDVLSGIIAGLLAQGMPPFEAAAGGVWMHGKAAEAFGPGLTAEDLPGQLPAVLRDLSSMPPD